MQQLQQTRRRLIFKEACQSSGILLGCRVQSGAHGSAAIVAGTSKNTRLWLTSELFCWETCFKRRKCFVHREDRGSDGLQFSRGCSQAQGLMAPEASFLVALEFFGGRWSDELCPKPRCRRGPFVPSLVFAAKS